MELAYIDSHIHVWPESACAPSKHTWANDPFMQPIATERSPEAYLAAVAQYSSYDPSFSPDPKFSGHGERIATVPARHRGYVFVEADPQPGDPSLPLAERYASALDEMKYVRQCAEGGSGSMMLGIIMWAPMDAGVAVLRAYLDLAKDVVGGEVWARVKGVRFLLQGMSEETWQRVVESDGFEECLREIHSRGWIFEVGVDQHRREWQMGCILRALERWRGNGVGVQFVFDHILKPDFASSSSAAFAVWSKTISSLAALPGTFVKLSGVFSELSPEQVQSCSITDLVDILQPWLSHVFDNFTPERIMFGSDWPVCEINGGGARSWSIWTAVVQEAMWRMGIDARDQQRVWAETASRVLKLTAL